MGIWGALDVAQNFHIAKQLAGQRVISRSLGFRPKPFDPKSSGGAEMAFTKFKAGAIYLPGYSLATLVNNQPGRLSLGLGITLGTALGINNLSPDTLQLFSSSLGLISGIGLGSFSVYSLWNLIKNPFIKAMLWSGLPAGTAMIMNGLSPDSLQPFLNNAGLIFGLSATATIGAGFKVISNLIPKIDFVTPQAVTTAPLSSTSESGIEVQPINILGKNIFPGIREIDPRMADALAILQAAAGTGICKDCDDFQLNLKGGGLYIKFSGDEDWFNLCNGKKYKEHPGVNLENINPDISAHPIPAVQEFAKMLTEAKRTNLFPLEKSGCEFKIAEAEIYFKLPEQKENKWLDLHELNNFAYRPDWNYPGPDFKITPKETNQKVWLAFKTKFFPQGDFRIEVAGGKVFVKIPPRNVWTGLPDGKTYTQTDSSALPNLQPAILAHPNRNIQESARQLAEAKLTGFLPQNLPAEKKTQNQQTYLKIEGTNDWINITNGKTYGYEYSPERQGNVFMEKSTDPAKPPAAPKEYKFIHTPIHPSIVILAKSYPFIQEMLEIVSKIKTQTGYNSSDFPFGFKVRKRIPYVKFEGQQTWLNLFDGKHYDYTKSTNTFSEH